MKLLFVRLPQQHNTLLLKVKLKVKYDRSDKHSNVCETPKETVTESLDPDTVQHQERVFPQPLI